MFNIARSVCLISHCLTSSYIRYKLCLGSNWFMSVVIHYGSYNFLCVKWAYGRGKCWMIIDIQCYNIPFFTVKKKMSSWFQRWAQPEKINHPFALNHMMQDNVPSPFVPTVIFSCCSTSPNVPLFDRLYLVVNLISAFFTLNVYLYYRRGLAGCFCVCCCWDWKSESSLFFQLSSRWIQGLAISNVNSCLQLDYLSAHQ